jgi:membrane protein
MRSLWHVFFRALRRVFPGCVTQSQAVAFNMFLAFFPMLLVVFAVLSRSVGLRSAILEMSARVSALMPPGTEAMVMHFLERQSHHPVRLLFVGIGGTLLAGSQAMRLTIEGFSMAHRDEDRTSLWELNARSLLLLLATLIPFLLTVVLTVFGKQVRTWMILRSGMPVLVRVLWFGLYITAGLSLLMVVLAVIYRVGRAGTRSFRDNLPGAAVATLLWWAVNGALGYYVRHMPYSLIYGGLAGAIGLMIWMQLTAMIVFLGAAFNAEYALRAGAAPAGDRQLAEE